MNTAVRGLLDAVSKCSDVVRQPRKTHQAKETAKLGHGFLTYALVEEGLKTTAADRAPRDGQVLLREWLDYATQRVPQIHEDELAAQLKLRRQLAIEQSSPGKPYGPSADENPFK